MQLAKPSWPPCPWHFERKRTTGLFASQNLNIVGKSTHKSQFLLQFLLKKTSFQLSSCIKGSVFDGLFLVSSMALQYFFAMRACLMASCSSPTRWRMNESSATDDHEIWVNLGILPLANSDQAFIFGWWKLGDPSIPYQLPRLHPGWGGLIQK